MFFLLPNVPLDWSATLRGEKASGGDEVRICTARCVQSTEISNTADP